MLRFFSPPTPPSFLHLESCLPQQRSAQRARRLDTNNRQKHSLHFVRVSSFGQWLETESEKQTITDICCQLSERDETERSRGRSLTPTLLIKKSLSALCSLTKRRPHSRAEHTREYEAKHCVRHFLFPSSYSNQTWKYLLRLCRRSHNILSMIHNYRNWMGCGFGRGGGLIREKEIQEAKQ